MAFECDGNSCSASDDMVSIAVALGILFVLIAIIVGCIKCRRFRTKPAPVIRFVDSQNDVYIVGIDNVVVVNTVGL